MSKKKSVKKKSSKTREKGSLKKQSCKCKQKIRLQTCNFQNNYYLRDCECGGKDSVQPEKIEEQVELLRRKIRNLEKKKGEQEDKKEGGFFASKKKKNKQKSRGVSKGPNKNQIIILNDSKKKSKKVKINSEVQKNFKFEKTRSKFDIFQTESKEEPTLKTQVITKQLKNSTSNGCFNAKQSRKLLKKSLSCKNTVNMKKLSKQKTKKNLISQKKERKQKVMSRKSTAKAQLIKNKNQNSLKKLFESYKKIKHFNPDQKIDESQLSQMKTKVEYIYQQIQQKLQKFKKKRGTQDNSVIIRREQAAIVIQKFTRGFLVRKFIKNYFENMITYQSIEEQKKSNVSRTWISKQENNPLNTKQKKQQRVLDMSKNSLSIKKKPKNLNLENLQESLYENQCPSQYSSQIRKFVLQEYEVWQKLNKVLLDISSIVQQKDDCNVKFNVLFNEVKKITEQKLKQTHQISTKKNSASIQDLHQAMQNTQPIQLKKSPKSENFHKILKKDQMEIWPQNISKSVLLGEKGDQDVFLTERKYKSHRDQNFFSVKKVSQKQRDSFRQSKVEETQLQLSPKIEKKKLNEEEINDIVQQSINLLIEDFIDDDLWNTLIVLAINQQNQQQDDEAILGIRTNISSVIEYCNLLIGYILSKYQDYMKVAVRKILQEQAVKSLFDQNSEFEIESVCWKRKLNRDHILNEEIYLALESEILENYKDMNIQDSLFELQKIYHRSIFDSFSEILSELVVIKFSNVLKNKEKILDDISKISISLEDLQQLLTQGKRRLIEYSMLMCGLMGDKDDSMMSAQIRKCDNNTLSLIKEERMFKMTSVEFLHDRKNFYEYFKNFFTNTCLFQLAKEIENELFDDVTLFLQNFLNQFIHK